MSNSSTLAPSPPPSNSSAPAAPSAPDESPRRSIWKLAALGTVGAILLVVAGAVGLSRSDDDDGPQAAPSAAAAAPFEAVFRAGPGAPLTDVIAQLQAQLESTPNDDVSWATLGLAYVQQARISVNPSFYELAEGALDRSFEVNDTNNFIGYAGRSALASARHEFSLARDFATAGLEINEYSALLWGALSDAETELGEYELAAEHVQTMVDLSPDTTSLARASYTWELRGEVAQASELMQRALMAAPTGDDRAFALYFLGELSFNQGDANEALGYYNDALVASPSDVAAQSGRAKALAAAGQTSTALDTYAALVQRVPDPAYLTAYGELLQSLGREAEAAEQFRIVEVTRELYRANGVQPDGAEVLYLADHGDPVAALALAETAIDARPFLAVHDAFAWALYRNGRYAEALEHSQLALATGFQNASFLYHSGMIKQALGQRDAAATDLEAALDMNPHFSPIGAIDAADTLAAISQNNSRGS